MYRDIHLERNIRNVLGGVSFHTICMHVGIIKGLNFPMNQKQLSLALADNLLLLVTK